MFEHFTFDTPLNLAYGLITGLVFGFLLQKGAVTRFRVIVGQFLWADHTVLRTMLTAVVVGGLGVLAMHQLFDVPLHIKGAQLGANALGGVIFGVGMALLGYCPGTAVGAMGEGSRHARFGVLGMLAGAAIYAEVHPWFKSHVASIGDLGKITLADAMHLNPWVLMTALVVVAAVLFTLLHGRGKAPNA